MNPSRASCRVMALCLVLGVVLVGCGSGDEADHQAGGQQHQAQPGQTQSGQAQHQQAQTGPAGQQAGPAGARPAGRPEQPATPVAVAMATRGAIASYYNATATLEAEKQAEVLARVEGVVKQLYCEEGHLVKAGAPLLQIDNDEYQLRLKQAEANTANLRSRFERIEMMMAEELGTEEEFQAAKSELATAEAEEGMARLNVSYTTVTAPFSGKVTSRLVDLGQNVSIGTPLFVLADFNPLLARVYVPSKEFKKLQADQSVTLILDSNQQRMQGRIKLISPVIDPTSGTIKITVEIPEYPPNTRPGDFTEVQIVTERRNDTLLVPRIAVLSDRGEDVVYVAAGGTAERRVVEVGFMDNDHAEILSGVENGEQIVVKGQRSLKHGDPIKILTPGDATADDHAVAQGEES